MKNHGQICILYHVKEARSKRPHSVQLHYEKISRRLKCTETENRTPCGKRMKRNCRWAGEVFWRLGNALKLEVTNSLILMTIWIKKKKIPELSENTIQWQGTCLALGPLSGTLKSFHPATCPLHRAVTDLCVEGGRQSWETPVEAVLRCLHFPDKLYSLQPSLSFPFVDETPSSVLMPCGRGVRDT